ncbi:MAG: GLUG motif-containing protein [Planctomycetota bacterium]|jgi:hypothetical protein
MSETRISSLLEKVTALVLICFFCLPVQAKYSGGTGEPNNPYQIADANDMNEIGIHPEDMSAHFILVNDINLIEYSGTEFNIKGTFSGTFDGNGFVISNFTPTSEHPGGGDIGLFDHLTGEIRNVGLLNVNISLNPMTSKVAGGLVANSHGTILNCYSVGNVSANRYVGGLVGCNYGTISDCYAKGSVFAYSAQAGGLVGINSEGGRIIKCFAHCSVSAPDRIGGLVGYNYYGTISDCYATGSVSGNNCVGGLVGYHSWDTISNCLAAGVVDGNDDTGGLIGIGQYGSCTNCFWNSDINPDMNGIGNTTDPNVIGKSTAQMQTESTFTGAGWDFVEIWNIGENQTYPYLRVYPAGDINKDRIVNFLDIAITANQWMQEQ